jgi:lipopolysaccharide transport system permease protein
MTTETRRATVTGQPPAVVNSPPKRWSLPDLHEIWERRELVYFLGRRDVAVRYKQTVIGVAWVVLQPVLLTVVFSVLVQLLGRHEISTSGVPYPVFSLAGLTMWLFLAACVTRVPESTVSSVELIGKVYFPRLVIPIAAVLPPLVDFCITLVLLIIVMLAYGVIPTAHLLLLPLVCTVAVVTGVGISIWLSALVVRFRDVRLVTPFMTQFLLFATPVLYQLDQVPARFQILYSLNPLVAPMELFRWAVLPDASAPGVATLLSMGVSIVLLLGGLLYFSRAEASFADVI